MRKATLLLLCVVCLVIIGCTTAQVQQSASAPETEIQEGCNLITLYWNGNSDLSTCDVWMWWDGKDGSGYPFEPCEYGGKCSVNVPEDIAEVGFIVRTDCSDPGQNFWGTANKDWAEDRVAVMTDHETVIYLKAGQSEQYRSSDGGKTLEQIRFFNLAGIISKNQIRYFLAPGTDDVMSSLKVTDQNGREIAISGLSDVWLNGTSGVITLAEDLDIASQYNVYIEGYGSKAALPTEIFDSEDFIANYTYDGDDLGAVIMGDKTQFKVWAPTASAVVLNLFEAGDGGSAFASVAMERQDKGVWCITYPCTSGTYYTYSVTTASGTQEAVDPYAFAAGVNGDRGMVIDLDSTDPEGFDKDSFVSLASYSDAAIWEVHVRDFSNKLAASQYKGKYLAFTETGLVNSSGMAVGVDYLKQLGISHVHLQPVYDFATVDETRLDEPQFNWGYDPKNYNVPEGSYSTDPYHGEVRVNEFKQMVQALHNEGIGVVMDVVYNHTYDINSNLSKIVPYYYYRYTSSGAPSNGSGCGNETASERAMYRKYMVDSIVHWLTEYHLDGFRFDLMAIHDIETMAQIEAAVHKINPSALIYGEGWTGGTVQIAGSEQASQANIAKITATPGAAGSIAVFNDSIRDGLKGSVFAVNTRGYINGSPSADTANKIAFGLRGGVKTTGTNWSVKNSMVINYMSSHDNHTLWDKLSGSNPNATKEELLAMQRLGATTMMIAKGTPFMLAGEELLRTKGGDGNSYKSSDEVNNIDWEVLKEGSDEAQMAAFYAELIAMRDEYSFLHEADVSYKVLNDFVLEVTYRIHGNIKAIAVINPQVSEIQYTLQGGDWKLVLRDNEFLHEGSTVSGTQSVAGKSILFVDR